MFALGIITTEKAVNRDTIVELLIKSEWKPFLIDKDFSVPKEYPEWGLFQYDENGEYCKWVHPEEMK